MMTDKQTDKQHTNQQKIEWILNQLAKYRAPDVSNNLSATNKQCDVMIWREPVSFKVNMYQILSEK